MKKEFLAMVLARGASSLLQAANLVMLARYTAISDFGLLAILTSMAVLVSTVFDLGMSPLIVKSAAQQRTAVVIAGLSLNSKTSAFLAISASCLFGILATLGYTPLWAGVLVLGLALEKKVETCLSVFIADRNRILPNLSILSRRLTPMLGTVTAVLINVDPLLFFASCYVLAVVANIIYLDQLLVMRYGVRKNARSDMRGLIKAAWPFYIGNLSAHLRFLDTALVAAVASVHGAALYSAASKIVNPLQLVPQTLTTVLMPHSAQLSPGEARKLVDRLCGLFLSMLILLIPTAFFAETVVVFILGTGFRDSASVLAASLVGLPFVTLASPLGSVLQSQGHERFVAFNGLLFSGLLVVAMLLGALTLGIAGAAAAVGITFLVKCISLFAQSRKLRG